MQLARVDPPRAVQPQPVQPPKPAASNPYVSVPKQEYTPRLNVRALKQVKPDYPELARRLGVSGEVIVEARLNIDGRC